MSASIVAQLLFLEADGPDKPIHLYINSQGGSVTSGLAIYDTMQSIMVHQPSGGYAGQASDIAIHAKEIIRVRNQLNKIYKYHLTGKEDLSLEQIEKMMERDYFMSAEEALDVGIVDEILSSRALHQQKDDQK
ncbi:MAG: hypothetical protein Q9227_002479 [Pyrenula ochraceoflavens]